jgi:hydrogenase expression/formation protein HypD
MEDLNLDGFIAPGHVSAIIGAKAYASFPDFYKIPTVVVGFEPLDILFGVYMILRQIIKGKPVLENAYKLAVSWDGNVKAQNIMNEVFDAVNGRWRGIGTINSSKFILREKYVSYDSRIKHNVKIESGIDLQPGCKCHLVVIGKIEPTECPLFMKSCTPQKPRGACMVSVEGTCNIWAKMTFSNQA